MNRKFVMGLFLVGIMISTITIGLKFILLDFHFKEEYEWGSDKDFFDNPHAVSPIANSSSFFVIDEEGVKILGSSSWRGNHLILRGNLSVPNNNFTDIAFGSDGLSYVLDEKSGLFVFNISLTESTQNPQIISELQIDENFDGLFKEILVKDDLAYLAAGYNGVIIVNVSNPTDPVVIGKHYDNFGKDNYLEDGASFGLNVRKEEGRTMIFVADWGDGLEILDATDPVNIKKVTELSIYGPENTPIKARDVELMGNYAYLATTSGVISVNISNKHQLNNMSAKLILPRKNGKAWSLEKKGEFLFVSFGIDGLKTFKMTDDSTLEPRGTYTLIEPQTENEAAQKATIKRTACDIQNSKLYVLSDFKIVILDIGTQVGDFQFLILFPISTALSLAMMVIWKRSYELEKKYQEIFLQKNLSGYSKDELKHILKELKLIRHKFADHFTPKGALFVENFYKDRRSENFEALWNYYKKSPLEIANLIVRGVNLEREQKKRLMHEGDFKVRQLLEAKLDANHPLIKKLNEKYTIKTKSGASLIK